MIQPESSTTLLNFDDLDCATKSSMYCRNIIRRILRFPIFPMTFIVLLILLLSLQQDVIQFPPSPPPPLPPVAAAVAALEDVAPREHRPSLAIRSPSLDHHLRLGLEKCPDSRRPLPSEVRTRNQQWQYHNPSPGEEIIVYSAFFDDRALNEFTTWIRILGVASIPSKRAFCHVWFDDQATPFVTPAVLNVTGRRQGYSYNRTAYVQYLFSCLLPGIEPVPSHVSLTTNQCDNSTIYLPVQRPVRATPDQDFGICVPIAFGSLPVPVFVEWIELTRMFGVTEFNVYDSNMTGMTEVFEHYKSTGLLRVFPIPPAVDLYNMDGVKLGSAVSLNDCMMRNMYRYRLILIIDFDEVIIPRLHLTYSAMLEHINKAHKLTDLHRGYGFRNAYFFRDHKPDAQQPWYLRTAVYRSRSELSKYPVNPKSFIDPRQCLSAFNHFCYLPLKAGSRPAYVDVHNSIAATHHYRKCGFSKSKCHEYLNASYTDNMALKFKDQLMPRVTDVLTKLAVITSV